MIFNNPFKRNEREQQRLKQEAEEREQSQSRLPRANSSGRSLQRQITPRQRLTTSECLAKVQNLLEQLQAMPANDIHAFPLLNESQRFVQQLRDEAVSLPSSDRDAWLFQIGDLQDAVQMQTERILSSASTSPQRGSDGSTQDRGSVHAHAVAAAIAIKRGKLRNPSGSSRPGSSNPGMPLSTQSRPILQRAIRTFIPTAFDDKEPAASQQPSMLSPGADKVRPSFHSQTVQQKSPAAYRQSPSAPRPGQQAPNGSLARTSTPSLSTVQQRQAVQQPQGQRQHLVLQPLLLQQQQQAALLQHQGQQPDLRQAPQQHTPGVETADDDMFSGLSVVEPLQSPHGAVPRGAGQISVQPTLPVPFPAPTEHSTTQAVMPAATASAGLPLAAGAEPSFVTRAPAAAAAAAAAATSPHGSGSWSPEMAAAAAAAAPSPLPGPASPHMDAAAAAAGAAAVTATPRAAAAPAAVASPPAAARASVPQSPGSFWSADMSAAAAQASPMGQTSPMDGTKLIKKKKTRGLRLGYGIAEDMQGPSSHGVGGLPTAPAPVQLVSSATAAESAAAVAAAARHLDLEEPGLSGQCSHQEGLPASLPQDLAVPAWVHQQQQKQPAASQLGQQQQLQPGVLQQEQQQQQPGTSQLGQQWQLADALQPLPLEASEQHAQVHQQQDPVGLLQQQQQQPQQPQQQQQLEEQHQQHHITTSLSATLLPEEHQALPTSYPAPVQSMANSPAAGASTCSPADNQQELPAVAPAPGEVMANLPAVGALTLFADGQQESQVKTLPEDEQQELQDAAAAPDFLGGSAKSSSHLPSYASHAAGLATAATAAPAGTAVERLQAFLSTLSSPIDACQQAAAAAATEAVQQLVAAAAAAQQQEQSTLKQRQACILSIASCSSEKSQLQRQQEAAVEQEDFEAAEALEVKIVKISSKIESLEAEAKQLEEAAAQAAELRLKLLSSQAAAWEAAAGCLLQLHSRHAAAQAAAAAQEAHALAEISAQCVQEEAAVAHSREALLQRGWEIAVMKEDLEGRVLVAAGPVYEEHRRLTQQTSELEAEVERLRALLADHERQLAEATQQLLAASSKIQQAAAPFAPELAAVQEAEAQLREQDARLDEQASALQQHRAEVAERQRAAERGQESAKQQLQEVAEAAEQLARRAEEARRKAAAEAASMAKRQGLVVAEQAARESLMWLCKCIEDLESELTELVSKSSKLAADAVGVQQQAQAAAKQLPELEAAKKAAAARKDFKEAARLSAEVKAAQLQADSLAQRLTQLQAASEQAAVAEASKSEELQQLRAMLPELQQGLAKAQYMSVRHSIERKQELVDAAAGEERYEDAQKLQVELDADLAEAARLEEALGIQAPSREAQAPVLQQPGQEQEHSALEPAVVVQCGQVEEDLSTVRYRSLCRSIEQKQELLDTAAEEERYEDAQQLQVELEADLAEAARLERALGIQPADRQGKVPSGQCQGEAALHHQQQQEQQDLAPGHDRMLALEAAMTEYGLLRQSIARKQLLVDTAAEEERYEDAQQLQSEVEAELAEAARLEKALGIQWLGQDNTQLPNGEHAYVQASGQENAPLHKALQWCNGVQGPGQEPQQQAQSEAQGSHAQNMPCQNMAGHVASEHGQAEGYCALGMEAAQQQSGGSDALGMEAAQQQMGGSDACVPCTLVAPDPGSGQGMPLQEAAGVAGALLEESMALSCDDASVEVVSLVAASSDLT